MSRPGSESWLRLMRFMTAVMVLGSSLAGLLGCGRSSESWEGQTGTPRVVVTIPPLYSFVRGVAGETPAVVCLCATTGPYEFFPEPSDIAMLKRADLIFSIGLSLDEDPISVLESFADRKNLNKKLGDRIPEDLLHGLRKGEVHNYRGKYDPHVWLGIPQAIKLVELIRDEMCKVDKRHKDEYAKNATEYIATLKILEWEGKRLLAEKKTKHIVNSDKTLSYFAETFGLKIAYVKDQMPDSARKRDPFLELVDLCRDETKPIGAIVVPPSYLMTPSAAKTKKRLQARGVNIELAQVDPLETADPGELIKEGAEWYETRMRQNLKDLAKVMK